MNELPLTLFDAVVLVVVGLAALSAFTRGAVREILGVASWLAAAIAAFAALPQVGPLMRQAVTSDTVADVLAVAGVFLVTLVALKLLGGMIARAVEDSALGPLDKLLGLAVGTLKGAIIVCAAYLVVSHLIRPDLQPDWIRQAYLIKPVQTGALMLERLVPERYRQEGLAAGIAAADAVERAVEGAKAAGATEQGYSAEQRQALEKLLAPQR